MGADHPLADSAVLIIDVINDFTFPGSDQLLEQMPPVVKAIDALRRHADALQRPVIHVNDNFGRWRSSFDQVIEYCRRKGAPGASIATALAPRHSDYFVLKPGQSGFFQTPLPALLDYLKIKNLVLAGVAGDQCVLTTAMDAHARFPVMGTGGHHGVDHAATQPARTRLHQRGAGWKRRAGARELNQAAHANAFRSCAPGEHPRRRDLPTGPTRSEACRRQGSHRGGSGWAQD